MNLCLIFSKIFLICWNRLKRKRLCVYLVYLNKYTEEPITQLLNSCYGENSVKIDNHIVFHFPTRIYNGLEDLAETILNPANWHTSRIPVSLKENPDFTTPEPVYVYTDIIKANLVGDSYVKLLTTLHFPSSTGYHRFDFPLYRPVEQSFIESITIRLLTKIADVLFEDSDIPCVVTLHFKKQVLGAVKLSILITMDRYTLYYVNHSGGGGEIGPVYRETFRVQRVNGIGSFCRGLFRFVKPLLYSGAKAVGKGALKQVQI